MFYNFKKLFSGVGSAYFRGVAYFPDSLASVEKGAYFRGALILSRGLCGITNDFKFQHVNNGLP